MVIVNAILVVERQIDKSSHRRFSIKKDVLTNFWAFTGKHLCQSLFFKRLYYRFLPVNFPNFVGPLFLKNTFERLLLYLVPCQMSMKEIFCGNSKSLTVFAKKKKPSYVYFYKGSNHVLLVVSCSCIVNKITWRYSSSRSQMFLKIVVLKKIATGKQLRCNFFLIKLITLSSATLSKKAPTQVFSCEICKILRIPFSKVHLG